MIQIYDGNLAWMQKLGGQGDTNMIYLMNVKNTEMRVAVRAKCREKARIESIEDIAFEAACP